MNNSEDSDINFSNLSDSEKSEIVQLVEHLFISRADVYAEQKVHDGKQSYNSVKQPLTVEVLSKHFKGEDTIGTYQIEPKTVRVKWGVLDIDGEHVADAKAKTEKLRQRLVNAGIGCNNLLMEESGSPDSYHLWLFFEKPTEAKEVKEFLERIAKPVDLEIEIFPKQDKISTDGFGNLVKLPFGFHKVAKTWSDCYIQTEEGERIVGFDTLKHIEPGKLPERTKLKTTGLRPCFECAIDKMWALEGAEGHEFRLALLCEMMMNNYPEEDIHKVYKLQSDYSAEKTQENIDYAREKGYKPWKCETIRDKCSTLLAGMCTTCVKTEIKRKTSGAEVEEEKFKHKAYFEKDDTLYLEILTTDEQYKFAYLDDSGDVELIDYVDDTLPVELPITKEGELAFIVKLPSEDITKCESLEADELIDLIEKHIRKYCDMPNMDIKLCSYYALFTWFYKKCNTTGYLRFLADSGKGKSRMLTVVSDICLYPTSTGGSSSFSGMMRTNERWHGTLVIDEADISGDKGNQVIKYLNLGFEHGKYFMLSDKNDPKQQEVFDPFSPKIIGMREHFRDNATEGRLLSISPHETTDEDIPIILDNAYYKESAVIRNYIARFVLEYWPTVDGGKMLSFGGLGIEPRLQQLAMPLSIIFQLWARGSETFKNYMMNRQKELKKDRAQSWEGNMFNLVYAIAKGNERVKDFEGYYDSNGEIQAIAPTMMAKTMNTSATTVTRTLRSVGFEGEQRYISEYVQIDADETEERRKRVRTYVVPDERTWREMIQRYYYEDFDEEVSDGTDGTDGTPYRTHKQKDNNGTDGTDILTDSGIIEIPNVLKSRKYDRVPCTVPSVPSVPSVPQNGDDRVNGTDGTQYSKHKGKINACEEDNPTAENQGELSGDSKGIGAEGTEKQQQPPLSPKAFDDDFQALEAKERLEAEGLEIDQDSSNEEQSEDCKRRNLKSCLIIQGPRP